MIAYEPHSMEFHIDEYLKSHGLSPIQGRG